MKIIPLLYCREMAEAIAFYTGILDFEMKYADASVSDWVVDLVNGEAEFQLTSLRGDQRAGIAVNIRVDDVDATFEKYVKRGLQIPASDRSPVHKGPLDQSWGMREFYVNDPSSNTLRFGRPIT